MLSTPEFFQKTEFQAKSLLFARTKLDVERERGNKPKSDTNAKTVMGESSNPLIDRSRQFTQYVAKDLLKHPTLNPDLFNG